MQVTVVLEHMFHPSEMEEEATLREDLEDDIKTECLKMGPLEKVSSKSSPLLPTPMIASMSAKLWYAVSPASYMFHAPQLWQESSYQWCKCYMMLLHTYIMHAFRR